MSGYLKFIRADDYNRFAKDSKRCNPDLTDKAIEERFVQNLVTLAETANHNQMP